MNVGSIVRYISGIELRGPRPGWLLSLGQIAMNAGRAGVGGICSDWERTRRVHRCAGVCNAGGRFLAASRVRNPRIWSWSIWIAIVGSGTTSAGTGQTGCDGKPELDLPGDCSSLVTYIGEEGDDPGDY